MRECERGGQRSKEIGARARGAPADSRRKRQGEEGERERGTERSRDEERDVLHEKTDSSKARKKKRVKGKKNLP